MCIYGDTSELLPSHWTDKSEAAAVAVNWCAGTWVEKHLPDYMQLTFILLFLLYRACWMVSCGIEECREGAETMSLRHSQISSADSRITRVTHSAAVQTWCWNSALNRTITQSLFELSLYKTLKQLDNANLPLKPSVEADTDSKSFMLQACGSGLWCKHTI